MITRRLFIDHTNFKICIHKCFLRNQLIFIISIYFQRDRQTTNISTVIIQIEKMEEQPPSKKSKKDPLPEFLPFIKKDDADAFSHFLKTKDVSSAKIYFGGKLSRVNYCNPLCKILVYKNLPDTFNEYTWQEGDFDLLTRHDLCFLDEADRLKEAIVHKKTNLFENFVKHGINLKNLSVEHQELALNSDFPIVMQCSTEERFNDFNSSLSSNELTCPSCDKLAAKLVVRKNCLAKCTHCYSPLSMRKDEYLYPFLSCTKCEKINNTIYNVCFDCLTLENPKISKNMQLFLTKEPEVVAEPMNEADLKTVFHSMSSDFDRLKDCFLMNKFDELQEACSSLVNQTNFFKKSVHQQKE